MIELHHVTEVLDYLDGLKAVVFDLDDTLYSESDYVKSGYQMIANAVSGITFEELWNAFRDGKPAIDAVLMQHGRLSEKERCLSIYRSQMPDISVYEGVYAMLRTIRAKGLKIGMITDGRPEGQHNKIEALKLKTYFDKIIVTDELGGVECRKPNPLAFECMQKELGCAYSEMSYVGDNNKKDGIAPEQLGMHFFLIHNQNGLYR